VSKFHATQSISTNMRDSSGFTLLEVMISLVILTFISLAIYNATSSAFQLRDSLQREGDFLNKVRITMNLVQTDISQIYSPKLLAPPSAEPQNPNAPQTPGQPPDAQDMGLIMSDDAGQQTQFWAAATDKTGIRASRLVGNESKLTFVALSHKRIYKESEESEFAKITYELRPSDVIPDTQVLVKIENAKAPFGADDPRDTNSIVYPLLHGIKKWNYQYYSKGKDNPARSWDSDSPDSKDKFPDLIEITFEVIDDHNQNFEGHYKIKPEVPLNGLDAST